MEQNREPGLTAARSRCGKILASTKDPEVKNLYTYAVVFLLSGRFQNSGPSFITLPCCMFRRERRGGEKQRQQRRSGAQHTEIQAFRYRAAETDKDKRQAMLVESNFNFHQLHLADQKLKKKIYPERREAE